MDLLHNLGIGLGVAFTTQNLAYAFCGALLGTLIGVLPGIGAVAAIALLLPATYALDTTPALILLAGVYYGAQYGGSTTAILVDVPGEPSALVTCLDGNQMARQGRAGVALSVAALGSFFAGCVGTIAIALVAPPLTELAFQFGPEEYFSLMVLGLVGAAVLTSGSLLKAIAMVLLGLLLAQVNAGMAAGTSPSGLVSVQSVRGISFVVLGIGVFVFAEIVAGLGHSKARREVCAGPVKGLWPSRLDFHEAWPSVLRGTALGAAIGVLPGGGAMLASFASYAVEKNLAGTPRIPLGKGAIEGVAGPESANNAAAQTAFIPMLTLGIPGNAAMALLVGAMAIKGIEPGPQVMASNPQLFWGLIASMWAGNVILLVLNLPLVGLWARLLAVPYRAVFPALVLVGCIGVYTLGGGAIDLYLTALFALVGYLFHKLGCEPAPLLLGFILGPIMEDHLRRSLLLSHGDWATFVTRPLSSSLLIAAALLIVVVTLPALRQTREVAFQED
ncbi:MAG TPA: tripartite tricarboxylate transporter permease [Caldimonas sp.]|nr:tripartite tricarboxylate transporter permease [Caldimonas sp.]